MKVSVWSALRSRAPLSAFVSDCETRESKQTWPAMFSALEAETDRAGVNCNVHMRYLTWCQSSERLPMWEKKTFRQVFVCASCGKQCDARSLAAQSLAAQDLDDEVAQLTPNAGCCLQLQPCPATDAWISRRCRMFSIVSPKHALLSSSNKSFSKSLLESASILVLKSMFGVMKAAWLDSMTWRIALSWAHVQGRTWDFCNQSSPGIYQAGCAAQKTQQEWSYAQNTRENYCASCEFQQGTRDQHRRMRHDQHHFWLPWFEPQTIDRCDTNWSCQLVASGSLPRRTSYPRHHYEAILSAW